MKKESVRVILDKYVHTIDIYGINGDAEVLLGNDATNNNIRHYRITLFHNFNVFYKESEYERSTTCTTNGGSRYNFYIRIIYKDLQNSDNEKQYIDNVLYQGGVTLTPKEVNEPLKVLLSFIKSLQPEYFENKEFKVLDVRYNMENIPDKSI